MKRSKNCVILKNLCIVLVALLGLQGVCWGKSKQACLEQLSAMKKENRAQLEKIEQNIQKHLEDQTKIALLHQSSQRELQSSSHQIKKLIQKRKSYVLKQEFIDRMKFHVSQKYNDQHDDLKAFLTAQLDEMAQKEALSSNGSEKLVTFLNYLRVAIRNMPEPQEDGLNFIESYFKSTSLDNPLSPHQFFQTRHYTNGIKNIVANHLSKESAGEMVHQQLSPKKAASVSTKAPQKEKHSIKLEHLTPKLHQSFE